MVTKSWKIVKNHRKLTPIFLHQISWFLLGILYHSIEEVKIFKTKWSDWKSEWKRGRNRGHKNPFFRPRGTIRIFWKKPSPTFWHFSLPFPIGFWFFIIWLCSQFSHLSIGIKNSERIIRFDGENDQNMVFLGFHHQHHDSFSEYYTIR
jgi:hypothetical protein